MDHELELVITGRGKVGDKSDIELFELDAKKTSKPVQGEFKDDLPRLREGDGSGSGHQRPNSSV